MLKESKYYQNLNTSNVILQSRAGLGGGSIDNYLNTSNVILQSFKLYYSTNKRII